MGNKAPLPERPPVKADVMSGERTRICVAGVGISHNTGRAQKLAAAIAAADPAKYETWFYFSTFGYKDALATIKEELKLPEDVLSKPSTLDANPKTIAEHTSSPFVWLEHSKGPAEVLGGRDKFAEWAGKTFPDEEEVQALAGVESPPFTELFFDNATPAGTWMGDQEA